MSDTLKRLSDEMASTVEQLSPGIVRVEGRRRLPATGIVWTADGLIVTAHHVVDREDGITIGLNDGSTVDAQVVGRDPHNDLVVLKTESSLSPVEWASNDELKVGHLVLALGRPGRQVQATLGVTSAIAGKMEMHHGPGKHKRGQGRGPRRRGRRGGSFMWGAPHGGPRGFGRALIDGHLQTDVTMYPGFSGGPLVSGDGKVHGLNTSGFSRGVSIAIPVSTIRQTVASLISHGRIQQGFLGVGVQPVRLPENVAESLDQETGLLIVSVEGDSPAHKSGLLVGDILTSLDGEAVAYVDELLLLLSSERVGKEVPVGYVRGGEVQTVNVTIAERS